MPTNLPPRSTPSRQRHHRTAPVRSIPRASSLLGCLLLLLLPIYISFLFPVVNVVDVAAVLPRARSPIDERATDDVPHYLPTDDYEDDDNYDDAMEEGGADAEMDAEGRGPRDGSMRSTDAGADLAKILRGRAPFPADDDVDALLRYRPGKNGHVGGLDMDSTEALRYCLVDDAHRTDHVRGGDYVSVGGGRRRGGGQTARTFVSLSHEHRLVYRHVPKSASSSSRTAMTEYFRGKDAVVLNVDELERLVRIENYTLVSFVREPLDRFYSSYDEAMLRWGPWIGSAENAAKMPGVAKFYRENRHRLDEEHPYLYEGINTYEDYVSLFYCSSEGKEGRCDDGVPVAVGGGLTLAQRFERFVSDYDGLRPFDNHLRCQVPYLVDNRDGLPLPISTLYDARDAEGGWRHIADRLGVVIPEGGLKVVRGAPRRFDVSKVSNATKEKICRLVALDYCCLNIELPEVCRTRDDEGVYCAIRKSKKGNRLGTKLYIQPWKE